jgi:hypothetical protein
MCLVWRKYSLTGFPSPDDEITLTGENGVYVVVMTLVSNAVSLVDNEYELKTLL